MDPNFVRLKHLGSKFFGPFFLHQKMFLTQTPKYFRFKMFLTQKSIRPQKIFGIQIFSTQNSLGPKIVIQFIFLYQQFFELVFYFDINNFFTQIFLVLFDIFYA